MGIAAYNRGNAVIARDTQRAIAEVRNSLDAKAQLWAELLRRGVILTFEAPDGAVVTAGPHITAVPTEAPRYSCYREGGGSRWRGQWEGSAWAIALHIVENVGRRRPKSCKET